MTEADETLRVFVGKPGLTTVLDRVRADVVVEVDERDRRSSASARSGVVSGVLTKNHYGPVGRRVEIVWKGN